MGATDTLREEHEVIQRMLAVLEAAASRLTTGEDVSPQVFVGAIDFVRTFADGCHHHKEEEALFPALEARGMPREGGPVGVMLTEHDEGRRLIRELDAAVGRLADRDPGARADIGQAVREYVALLRDHIAKENDVLFPMADRILTAEEQRQLSDSFERIEQEQAGPEVHERFHRLVEELERQFL